MILTLEWTLIAFWILIFITLIIHHIIIKDMIKYELKKLEEKMRNPQDDVKKALGNFIDKHKHLI